MFSILHARARACILCILKYVMKEEDSVTYHVDDLLKSDAKLHFQWFTLIRDRSLQGVVICQQVIQ